MGDVATLLRTIAIWHFVLSILGATAALSSAQVQPQWTARIPASVDRQIPITSFADPGAPARRQQPVYTTLPPPPGWTAEEFLHLASHPLTDPIPPVAQLTPTKGQLTDHKDGFFQKIEFSATWLPRTGNTYLGITEARTFLTVAVPFPTRELPLLISPGFDAIALNGPQSPDLPPQVYANYLEMMWLPKLADRWLGIFSVSPGIYTDYEHVTSSAWRIQARALARYQWAADRVQLMFGVLYLDRYDLNWLPAGGIIWTPNDSTRYEMVFPRPKLAHRLRQGPGHEDWVYFAGEFGGDQYAVTYPDGRDDNITLRDWRLYLGVERKLPGGAGQRLEVGYVFSRTIEFQSAPADYHTGDAIMLRCVIDF